MHVLLPVDADEDRAIAAAETTASLPNASESVRVTVLNIKKKIDVTTGDGGKISSDEWYDQDDFPSSVEKAMEVLENAEISAEKRREHADPAEAIAKIAEEIDADWIIMAGRKRTPIGKVLFGSVTQSVLLDSDLPVTVIAQ